MTLEQKVGAVMTLAFNGVVPKKHTYEYITKYHCGGLRLTPSIRGAMSYVDPRIGNTVKESHSSIKNLLWPCRFIRLEPNPFQRAGQLSFASPLALVR